MDKTTNDDVDDADVRKGIESSTIQKQKLKMVQ